MYIWVGIWCFGFDFLGLVFGDVFGDSGRSLRCLGLIVASSLGGIRF